MGWHAFREGLAVVSPAARDWSTIGSPRRALAAAVETKGQVRHGTNEVCCALATPGADFASQGGTVVGISASLPRRLSRAKPLKWEEERAGEVECSAIEQFRFCNPVIAGIGTHALLWN
jgi:hypothetical protein